ncbi:MAG: hypothetical protein PHS93_09350, partial [Candidatus Omnitrophica bacterium]|nr:hypothetical protein [Candidatus Omnitrophota bacterium]
MAKQDYILNTYNALKENLEGFNKSEQEFRDKLLSDPTYKDNVHKALTENVQGFNRTMDEFSTLIGVKKKDNSESSGLPLPSFESQRPSQSVLSGEGSLGTVPEVEVPQVPSSETPDKTSQNVLRQQPSLFKRYVQGIPKALNEEISSDLKLLDWVQEKATSGVTQLLFGKEVESARKQLSDAGVLSNRPFKFASDLIDEKLITGQAELPDDIPGNIVKGVVKTLPLIMETAVMPEVTVGRAMTKYGVGDLLKFPLIVSTKEGTVSLKETEGLPPGEQASEFAKSVGSGFKMGLEMSMLGKGTSTLAKNITDKLFKESIVGATSKSQLNNILASKNLTENTISTLSNAIGFGGIGAAEEFIETGKVTPQNFAVQAGMGFAFGLTGLSGALFGKAMTSLSGARKDMVINSVRSEKDPSELKMDAEKIASEAQVKTGEEQKKDIVSAVATDNAANLKAIINDIRENPNEYLDQINGSSLPQQMKDDLVNKVNLIVSETDIRHANAKPLVEEINTKLKQVENISNNPNYSEVEKEALLRPIQEGIDALKQKVDEIYNPVESGEQKPQEEPVKVVHAGDELITEVNDVKLQSRDKGEYGKGFYVSKTETNQLFYGKVKSYFEIDPTAKILNKETFDIDDWKRQETKKDNYDYDDVVKNPEKYDYEDLLKIKSFDDAVNYDKRGMNDYARKNGFDIFEATPEEIVVLNKKYIKPTVEGKPTEVSQQIRQQDEKKTEEGVQEVVPEIKAEDLKPKVTKTLYRTVGMPTEKTGNDFTFYGSKAVAEEYSAMWKNTTVESGKVSYSNPLEVTLGREEFSDPKFEKQYLEQAIKNSNDAVIFTQEGTGRKHYAIRNTPAETISPEVGQQPLTINKEGEPNAKEIRATVEKPSTEEGIKGEGGEQVRLRDVEENRVETEQSTQERVGGVKHELTAEAR